jgi:universal stress protein A
MKREIARERAMTEWKKITCAVDMSEPSHVAMEHAVDLARRLRAELTLVHVRSQPVGDSGVLVSSKGVLADETARAEETLERWRAEAEGHAGVPVRARIRWGDPVAEIVREASEEESELLVVGTHGRSGISRVALGSVAEGVMRRAPCPVLVLRERRPGIQPEREQGAQHV